MEGYHGLDELTHDTLGDDGWLHTGDVGEIDADGFVRITDRKKDLFKTSGGKYVAPAIIEGQFKAVCPYASQIVVHGAERNFCVAIITLDPDAMEQWAEHNDMAGRSYSEIVSSPQVRSLVEGYVSELNAKLIRWETIKKFAVLENDLTVESGEMTPSLKVKRKLVEDKYRDHLEKLYV
jgi:long-chain acyl-CoA synthetase